MENNEISMYIDVKLDIHDKRPESLKFKSWTRCQVKIEAIKCLPCFLRITFTRCEEDALDANSSAETPQVELNVSINVPGVTLSLAASRTKQHSYGLFWTQSRRDCFIYFALETEASCRRHMKWIKKSIKNLELYRQVFLEQRRNSREPCVSAQQGVAALTEATVKDVSSKFPRKELSAVKALSAALGPLPKIPDAANSSTWSRRVSRASEIYEEIFEGIQQHESGARLSRRYSRTSIASGIYEEMKPTTASNFNSIVEEALAASNNDFTPPLPPLPPPRKRINTFETELTGMLGEIPRSNTNPESDLAKKKKYKNVLDNIFGSGRAKRAESVSENQTCSAEELINCQVTPKRPGAYTAIQLPIYANECVIAAKRLKKPTKSKTALSIAKSKRNSFSSPDLSKINFIDAFDEDKVADILLHSFSNSSDDLDLSCESLDESSIFAGRNAEELLAHIYACKAKAESLESLNISQQIPNNFNFSACNSSSINLVGSSGAAPPLPTQKNKIIIEDLTGYCIMAPIKNKTNEVVLTGTESTSSGYSTGSYCSSISSCTNSTEEQPLCQPPAATIETGDVQLRKPPTPPPKNTAAKEAEESVIYENMLGSSLNSTTTSNDSAAYVNLIVSAATPPQLATVDFTCHLYENLLAVKAAQELEQPSPIALSTSTPTDSPLTAAQQNQPTLVEPTEEESYYQTPRKSIISVDDKVPSYYPNSCDTVKVRRRSHSPSKGASPSAYINNEKSTTNGLGLRQLVNIKMRRERKENLYISSPQQIIEQRHNSTTSTNTTSSSTANATTTPNKATKSANKSNKKTAAAAHKISENVYAVNHAKQNSNNNNKQGSGFSDEMKEKLQVELLQLAMLQNIDFKFDDTKTKHEIAAAPATKLPPSLNDLNATEEEYENCYQAANSASRLLHKYATLAKYGTSTAATVKTATPQHHLQLNQAANTKAQTPTTSKLDSPVATSAEVDMQLSGVKKFASLPRFKKIDFSPLKLRINNVLQRSNQHHDF